MTKQDELERALREAIVETNSDRNAYHKNPTDENWELYAESCKEEKKARDELRAYRNEGNQISSHMHEMLDEAPYWME